jgi:dTDP-4-dehydrorhamnose 3,5-epimerase
MMRQRFNKIDTPIAGLYRIERKPINDTRGFLSRFFCQQEFGKLELPFPIAQMNHTLTKKRGAVRGLHYQNPPYSEIKLVSCLVGEVWDVAVDLRHNSPSFLQWHAEILSGENQTSLYIPKGCAHGFQTMTENCQLLYLHSDSYQPSSEGGLNPADPKLAIKWPLTITELSERDRLHPPLDNEFFGVKL